MKDKKELELYVLYPKFVTAATFHLDRSPLNTEAELNAAGVIQLLTQNKKENIKRSEEKKKKKNVLEGDTIE